MKYLKPIKTLFFLVIFSTFSTSCTKDDISNPEDFTNITVKLKSTVGEMNKVYIDIEDVQLKVKENENSSRWVSLQTINQGVYNACDLKENNKLLLVDDLEVKADYVYEIRLILGDDNFMNINNVLHSLDVTSLGNATPSNLINTQLNSKRRYDIVIDIDIDGSVSYDDEENMMVLNPKLYTAIRQIEY